MKAEAVSRLENGEVRVTEWRFAAGAQTGWHRHGYDYVVVPLTDGLMRIVASAEHHGIEAGRSLLPQGGGCSTMSSTRGEDYLAFVEVELVEQPG
jgi:hypothetical protein